MTSFVSVGGEHYTERFNKEGYLISFVFERGNKDKAFPCRVLAANEHPMFVYDDFGTSGTVSANSAGGTGTSGLGFVDLVNARNQWYLDPAEEGKILHWFIGINPSTTRLFWQYPLNMFINGLPAAGGVDVTTDEGVDGRMSRYHNPSLLTENWGFKDKRPAYNVFNPCEDSMFVRLKFFPELLQVKWITEMKDELQNEVCKFGRKVRVGGTRAVLRPDWLKFEGFDLEEVGFRV